jgi:uncharacterized protein (DUF983 family)
MPEPSAAEQSVIKVGLRGRCPRCGQGRLFKGFLTLAPRCEVCGLDYAFADPADGPAFFAMMIMAIPVGILAVWIELVYEPPLWVHLVTTVPFMFLACVPVLRPFKGIMVASQYLHKAEEARFTVPERPKASSQ